MAELADALDLGSSGQPCRFKSCYPQRKDGMKACRLFCCCITTAVNFHNVMQCSKKVFVEPKESMIQLKKGIRFQGNFDRGVF